MKALKLASSSRDRERLKSACVQILDRGEKIKALKTWPPPLKQLKVPKSTRALSTREQVILLSSSKINGCKFPPWQEDPLPESFTRRAGEPLFM